MDKIDLIEKDYKICMATYKIANTSYEQIYKTGNYTLEDKEVILSQLGLVGEKCLKYIFAKKLMLIENSAFEAKTLDQFDEVLRGSNKRLNEIASILKIDMNTDEYKALLDYKDENSQKGHNFDYWYKIINVFMNNYIDKLLRDFLINKYLSEDILDDCKYHNEYYNYEYNDYQNAKFVSLLFPQFAWTFSRKTPNSEELLKKQKESIKKTGDAFTRFRYAFNNKNNVNINLEDAYELIKNIVDITNMIHKSDDLYFEFYDEFFDYRIDQVKKYIKVPNNNLDEYLKLNLSSNVFKVIFDSGFDYTVEEIKEFQKLGFNNESLFYLLSEEIGYNEIEELLKLGYKVEDINYVLMSVHNNIEIIKKYNEQGINDIEKIKELERKKEKEFDKKYKQFQKQNEISDFLDEMEERRRKFRL